MKLKIKTKVLYGGRLPEVIKKGEWVDLRSSKTVALDAPQAETLKKHTIDGKTVSHRDVVYDSYMIPLGVCMKIPKGFEAVIAPRSSTFNAFGIIQTNSIGIVDSSYCGNNDEWKMPVVALTDTVINAGDRICQFRIQLSQKATVWQKIKWLLSSGIKIVEVRDLNSEDRGGFGSTGINKFKK